MLQFLRHVRNAAAHDNRLHVPADPRPIPTWRGCRLTPEANEGRVFTEASQEIDYAEPVEFDEGILEPGDALFLVNDVTDYLCESDRRWPASRLCDGYDE